MKFKSIHTKKKTTTYSWTFKAVTTPTFIHSVDKVLRRFVFGVRYCLQFYIQLRPTYYESRKFHIKCLESSSTVWLKIGVLYWDTIGWTGLRSGVGMGRARGNWVMRVACLQENCPTNIYCASSNTPIIFTPTHTVRFIRVYVCIMWYFICRRGRYMNRQFIFMLLFMFTSQLSQGHEMPRCELLGCNWAAEVIGGEMTNILGIYGPYLGTLIPDVDFGMREIIKAFTSLGWNVKYLLSLAHWFKICTEYTQKPSSATKLGCTTR